MKIIPNGTRVRTAATLKQNDWSSAALAERKAGVTGIVTRYIQGSYGVYYHVLHDEGSTGYYNPGELTEIGASEMPPAMPPSEPAEWKQVTYNTFRLKVPGGWLYRYYQGGMAFVPTPK